MKSNRSGVVAVGVVGLAGALGSASIWMAGCSDKSSANPVIHDGGEGGTSEGGGSETGIAEVGSNEASTPPDEGPTPEAGGGDAGAQLLVTYAPTFTTSTLYVVDVAGKSVAGTLDFDGGFGIPFSQPTAPFLLEQAASVVARLDPTDPWKVVSSWNVQGSDAYDGGASYSDPYATLVATPTAAYVLRYTRNQIAVIDPSKTVTAGAPSATIDLSSLLQPNDHDGAVEMTAGVYVAATNRLYVVLGNIDKNLVVNNGANLLCPGTVSSVVAIDTTTNKLVSLGGTAPGGGIALTGFDPALVAYDAPGSRLIIDHSGCNTQAADGGAGTLVNRVIEAVDLTSKTTSILHDGVMDGFPSGLVYIDATHAVLGYDFTGAETVLWDPTKTDLGASLPNAPDTFVYDGKANLLGTLTTFGADGGSTTDIISAPLAGGAATTLVSSPFAPGGYVGGVDIWPHP